jgi:hypothetical protein
MGIDIFFVISGYMIFNIIYKKLQAITSNHFSFLDFYIRRIKRIFLALLTIFISSFAPG